MAFHTAASALRILLKYYKSYCASHSFIPDMSYKEVMKSFTAEEVKEPQGTSLHPLPTVPEQLLTYLNDFVGLVRSNWVGSDLVYYFSFVPMLLPAFPLCLFCFLENNARAGDTSPRKIYVRRHISLCLAVTLLKAF